jgi:hypothetical protein
LSALRSLLIAAVCAGCGRLSFDPLAAGDGGGSGSSDSVVQVDAATSACLNYVVAHVDSFSTSGDTFVDIPGGVLDLPATGDPWLFFVTAGIYSTSTQQQSVEIRYLVDDVVRATGQNQNASDEPMPWVYTDMLAATARRIHVQARDPFGTATIENVQLVAYRIPAGAERIGSELGTVQSVGTTFAPVLSTTINPSTTGDYLVLASATASESPGTNNIEIRLIDPVGGIWPMSSNGGLTFSNNRSTWRSVVWARAVNLTPGARMFMLDAATSAGTASVRDLRMVILRAVDIGLTDLYSLPPVTAATSENVDMGELNLAASSAPSDVVTFQALTVAGGTDATGTNFMEVEFQRDGNTRMRYRNYETSGAPVFPYGFVDAFTHTAATTLQNRFNVADPSRVVAGKESALIAFSRTCP